MINSMVLRRTHRRNSDEVLLPDDGKEGTMRSVEVKGDCWESIQKKKELWSSVSTWTKCLVWDHVSSNFKQDRPDLRKPLSVIRFLCYCFQCFDWKSASGLAIRLLETMLKSNEIARSCGFTHNFNHKKTRKCCFVPVALKVKKKW